MWKKPVYILKLYNKGGSWFYLFLRQSYSTLTNPLQLNPIESEKKSEHSSKWIKKNWSPTLKYQTKPQELITAVITNISRNPCDIKRTNTHIYCS